MTINRLDQIANRQRRNAVLDYLMGALVVIVLLFQVTALRNSAGVPLAEHVEAPVPTAHQVIDQGTLANTRCADEPGDEIAMGYDADADRC